MVLFALQTLLCFIAPINPSDSLSSSTSFPVIPVIRLPPPQISLRDEEGLSSGLACPCHRAVADTRQNEIRRISQIAPFHAAFSLWERARLLGLGFSRPRRIYFCYGPMTRSPSLRWLCQWHQSFGSPALCYPSYKASDCYLGGPFPTEHTNLNWTRSRNAFSTFSSRRFLPS